MLVFILILLLLAAIFGILGVVIKAVAFLVITILLTLSVLVFLAWWGFKRSARRVAADYDRREAERRRPSSGDGHSDPGSLPPIRDDRY
jgi:hypothetical protein